MKSRKRKKSKSRRPRKVTDPPMNGIVDRDTPLWRGETAEQLLEKRAKEKPAKKRGRKRGGKRSSSAMNPKEKELRRLERALPRRKTLAAKQRLKHRIQQLKRDLEAES